jgi:eukaryotic-like serine/threonine-protein kinase
VPSNTTGVEAELTTVLDGQDVELDSAQRLARGTDVGRYVVIDFVGSGGMGMVYSAFDPELDRKVAIKLLRPDARGGDTVRARDRLLREAQAMARLSHPNVLPVFDVGTHHDAVFVALEFVDGETLRAWLQREQPRWPRIVEVFVAAGRGLAAAHAENLVHRDFKPENVMIGRRGAVRVMDFGLARPAGDSESAEITHSGAHALPSSGTVALTRTGFVMGTPAYMAPEQHRSMAVDHRADQFAFCVALYEALYRERPFAGGTAEEIVAAVIAQRVRPAPASSEVPGWLRRAVLRGLADTPEQRWPDMNALVDALGRDRRRPWRWLGVLTASSVVAVAAGFAYGRHRDAEEPCTAFAGEPAGWDDARRNALREAFVGSKLAYADDTWSRIEPLLDHYVGTWSAARLDACIANRVLHEQPDVIFDAQLECFTERRAQLEGLLVVFEGADAAVVEHAADSVAGLELIEECLTPTTHDRSPPPPAEHRERIDELRGELARAAAQRSAARYQDALAIVAALERPADEIGWAPLRAEVGLLLGQLRAELGEIDEGASAVTDAAELGEATGMDELVARAYASLVEIVGVHGARTAEGERWARLATAKLRRLGGLPRVEAKLAMWRASMADTAGDYPAARRWTEDAVARWERIDADGPDHAMALGNLGRVDYRAQDIPAALAAFRRAHDVAVESYGPRHPEVAKLLSNMAACHTRMGELDESQRLLEQSLALFEDILPPDHPDLAITLTNLAALASRQHRYVEAIAISERVIAMRKRTLGPRSPKLAPTLNNLAVSLMALKRYDEAIAAYREAVEAYDTAYPGGHPEAAMMLTGIGEIELARGDPQQAIAPLERAERLASAAEGADPYVLAETRFLLARALWETAPARDRKRARALAEQGAATLRTAPESERRHLDDIERWLTAHPLSP